MCEPPKWFEERWRDNGHPLPCRPSVLLLSTSLAGAHFLFSWSRGHVSRGLDIMPSWLTRGRKDNSSHLSLSPYNLATGLSVLSLRGLSSVLENMDSLIPPFVFVLGCQSVMLRKEQGMSCGIESICESWSFPSLLCISSDEEAGTIRWFVTQVILEWQKVHNFTHYSPKKNKTKKNYSRTPLSLKIHHTTHFSQAKKSNRTF